MLRERLGGCGNMREQGSNLVLFLLVASARCEKRGNTNMQIFKISITTEMMGGAQVRLVLVFVAKLVRRLVSVSLERSR